MMTQTITLSIPDSIYRTAVRLANVTKRPVDEVVRESLINTLPPLDDVSADEADALAQLSMLSDDALWNVAGQMMPDSEQSELAELLDAQEQEELVESKKEQVEQILDEHSRIMVEKAHAWLLLARRGYRVPVQTS